MIIQFEKKHIVDVSKLFVKYYKSKRNSNGLLPLKYENIQIVQNMFNDILNNNQGLIAINKNKIIGYLIGWSNIKHFKGTSSGVYIPAWGYCFDSINNSTNIFYNLYEKLSSLWVQNKCFSHLISYFVDDKSLEKLLYGLGFGLLLIDGMRELSPFNIKYDKNIQFCEASECDIKELMVIEGKMNETLKKTPIYLYNSNNSLSITRIRKSFLDINKKTIIIKSYNKIIACVRGNLNMGPGSDILNEKDSLGINFAYTISEFRKKGYATILLNEILNWGRENHMKRCVVDFESANLIGRLFWTKYFDPIFYSAFRRIDDRI